MSRDELLFKDLSVALLVIAGIGLFLFGFASLLYENNFLGGKQYVEDVK